MGISIAIVVPSVLSSLLAFMAYIFTYRSYKQNGIRELLYISYGWLLIIPYVINYAIFEFITGIKFESFRIYLTGIIVLTAVLGLLVIYYQLIRLWGIKLPIRIYLLYALIFIGIPIYIDSIEWLWTGEIWIINYSNNFGLLFVSIPTIWLNIELSILSYKNIRIVQPKLRNHSKAIFIGFVFFSLSVIALIFERIVFQSDRTNYFVLVQSFGILLISHVIHSDPYSIIPANLNSKFMVIINRHSSEIILNHIFDEYDTIDKKLFSGTITAILALFEKITNQDSIPKEFGFLNYTIIISSHNNLLALYVCNRFSSAIHNLLCPILKKIELDPKLVSNENNEYSDYLDELFSFAI